MRVVERGLENVTVHLGIESVQESDRAKPHMRLRVGQALPEPLVRPVATMQTQNLQGGGAHGLVLAFCIESHGETPGDLAHKFGHDRCAALLVEADTRDAETSQ